MVKNVLPLGRKKTSFLMSVKEVLSTGPGNPLEDGLYVNINSITDYTRLKDISNTISPRASCLSLVI